MVKQKFKNFCFDYILGKVVDSVFQQVYKLDLNNLSSVGIDLLNQYVHYGYYSITLTVGIISIMIFMYIYKRSVKNKKKGE
jgi:hypothetical protein